MSGRAFSAAVRLVAGKVRVARIAAFDIASCACYVFTNWYYSNAVQKQTLDFNVYYLQMNFVGCTNKFIRVYEGCLIIPRNDTEGDRVFV